MPRRSLSVTLILGLALFSFCGQAAAQRCERLVAIGVGERAPYQWQAGDGSAQGASVALLRRIAGEAGFSLEVLGTETLAQAEAEVVSGRADLLIDAELRPELLTGLDFLHPPLQQIPVVAWVARERAFAYPQWDDLQGLRGVRMQDADAGVGQPAERLGLSVASDLTVAIRDMLNGDSDYVLYEQWAGQVVALRQGWAERVQVLLPPVYYRSRYLALSHSSACNSPALRGALATALHRIEAEAAGRPMVREQLRHWSGQQGFE